MCVHLCLSGHRVHHVTITFLFFFIFLYSQTMAIVNELGMEQLCAVMGSGASTVSLAACHLLQVMFEALTEGMKREIRGKDEAILPGEFWTLVMFMFGLGFI